MKETDTNNAPTEGKNETLAGVGGQVLGREGSAEAERLSTQVRREERGFQQRSYGWRKPIHPRVGTGGTDVMRLDTWADTAHSGPQRPRRGLGS